ncbi:MAG: SsrA-binding protein SmpB [Firmicutes bacterium]|jgi:SsrA-binding protein|nr:SsrA-binding protein SmpB [Bacillota bacterium]
MADGIKVVAENRKARHDYHIEETFEAGMVLTGTEVKSLRLGRANLRDSYAAIENGELFVYNMHISPYAHGNMFNHEPKRTRKLLMHKREIMRLLGQTQEKGYTLVPLKVYFRKGRAKLELALARGKKLYDKRESIARRDEKRRIDRILKEHAR